MSNINTIDVSLLKVYKNELSKEKTNFTTRSYNTFFNSYLYNSNCELLSNVVRNIEKKYRKLEASYDKINCFLEDYLSNVDSLEKSLINGTSISNLDNNLRRYIDSNIGELK